MAVGLTEVVIRLPTALTICWSIRMPFIEDLASYLPQIGGAAGILAVAKLLLDWKKDNRKSRQDVNSELWRLSDQRRDENKELELRVRRLEVAVFSLLAEVQRLDPQNPILSEMQPLIYPDP